MKQILGFITFMAFSINVNAYDFSAKNADGITIYYNYINNGTEVEVTYEAHYKSWNSNKLKYDYYYGGYRYYSNDNIVIQATVTYNGRTFPVTQLGSYAFRDSHVNSVIMPNSIKKLGSSVFQDSNIKEVTIPDGFTEIKSFTFSGCTSLKKVTFPEGLKVIDSYSFDECKSLTTVTIPESVTILRGFTDCLGIVSITIPKNVTDVLFSGCNNLIKIYSYIEDPVDLSTSLVSPFSETTRFTGTLYVPKGTIEKYRSKAGWSSITYIEEMQMPEYTLTYLLDGVEYKTCKIEQGSTITPETPTKEGYTFSGWNGLPEVMPGHDLTVTGSFDINHYNLRYFIDGREYKTYNIMYGASVIKESEPEQEGYTFSGWSEIPETMPAHDVTVKGTFTANKYKLTYYIDDKEYKTYEVACGTALTPEPEPEKDGFIFSGWSEIPETMPAHNVIVVGTYTEIPYVLSVTITAGKGNVSYNEQSISAGSMEFKLTEGSNATLTITPAPNYKISAVTINGENAMNQLTEGVLTLTDIKADKIVNISFERTSDKYTITMASAMITLCVDEDLDFTDVSGLEAYIGSGFNMETGTLLMTRVYDVPSGTGLLLAGMPGTYEVPYSTSRSIYVNLLEGVTKDTTLEQTSGDYANYLLADGAQGIGFYAINVATVLNAGKAYLRIPTEAAGSRQSINISYGDTTTSTGMNGVSVLESAPDNYFDLQGRKHFGRPAKQGIYMLNGRKVVVK